MLGQSATATSSGAPRSEPQLFIECVFYVGHFGTGKNGRCSLSFPFSVGESKFLEGWVKVSHVACISGLCKDTATQLLCSLNLTYFPLLDSKFAKILVIHTQSSRSMVESHAPPLLLFIFFLTVTFNQKPYLLLVSS